jgi:tRNA(Arg) A34 adenosine deaminase TadA
MRLVIQLSRSNAEHGPGEPFGAGVLDLETNRLITPGVNLVTTATISAAHAEIVAIMVAQQVVRLFDLGGPGQPPYELIASTEPCAQCFGSVPWSGVQRHLCGARNEDTRGVGFDEEPELPDWASALEERGIPVLRDVYREDAAAVLRNYAEGGGEDYNAGQGD